MSEVRARVGEAVDSVIRRWKRFVEKKGTLKELRRRAFHVKKTTKRKLALDTAKKRTLKRLSKDAQNLSGARRTGRRGSAKRSDRNQTNTTTEASTETK